MVEKKAKIETMTHQIKTITLDTGTWVFVQTADYFYEESLGIDSEPDEDGNLWLIYMIPDGFGEKSEVIMLPPGHTYTLIGKADSLTEDQWKQIVDSHIDVRRKSWYRDYSHVPMTDEKNAGLWDDNPKESGLSLLKSQEMEMETTVILKQND